MLKDNVMTPAELLAKKNAASQLPEIVANAVIIYGPPKSGKTELALKGLPMAGFNVLYVDLEKGHTTIHKLDDKLKEKIVVVRIPDFKDKPTAINTCLHMVTGAPVTFCNEHGEVDCVTCKARVKKGELDKDDAFTTIALNDFDPKEWVVVYDSLSQLTSSANAHVSRSLNLEKDKLTFDHWRHQGVLLEKFLDYLQNASYNSVLIAHEEMIELNDKTTKIAPGGGTKNFSAKVAKYFDHIVYTSVRNKKHNASSSTTDYANILTGSRTDVVIDMDNPATIGEFFGKKVERVATATKEAAANKLSGIKNRMGKMPTTIPRK